MHRLLSRFSFVLSVVTLLTVTAVAPPASAAATWVAPVSAPIWQGFSNPGHLGVDLGASRGTPIKAASIGVVQTVACNASLNGQPYPCDVDGSPQVMGCGWYVDVYHATSLVLTRYCHMGSRPVVNVGQSVKTGTILGNVGNSGNSSAPHLHFEFRLRGITGLIPIDPVRAMADRGAPLG